MFRFPSVNQLTPEFLAFGLIWYLVFLFSTTCHEASHALAAKIGGDLKRRPFNQAAHGMLACNIE